jgi:hypothetical protein
MLGVVVEVGAQPGGGQRIVDRVGVVDMAVGDWEHGALDRRAGVSDAAAFSLTRAGCSRPAASARTNNEPVPYERRGPVDLGIDTPPERGRDGLPGGEIGTSLVPRGPAVRAPTGENLRNYKG